MEYEPGYDISFNKPKSPNDATDTNDLPVSYGTGYDCSKDRSLCSCSRANNDVRGAGSGLSNYRNLVNCNNCSRFLVPRNFCKIPTPHLYDNVACAGSGNGFDSITLAAVAAAAAVNNAEDNKYTMILSRSCKPLKFSFASEWLV